jgi:phage terminase small subunit
MSPQLNTPESIAKRTATRRNKLSPKQKAFAKAYIAKKLNGTEAALATYETTDSNVAANIASENLNKPKIKREIEALLQQNDIEIADILGIHKRNMLQDENYPTSQKAVDSFYEILGLKAGDKPQNNVQIAFVIEK